MENISELTRTLLCFIFKFSVYPEILQWYDSICHSHIIAYKLSHNHLPSGITYTCCLSHVIGIRPGVIIINNNYTHQWKCKQKSTSLRLCISMYVVTFATKCMNCLLKGEKSKNFKLQWKNDPPMRIFAITIQE